MKRRPVWMRGLPVGGNSGAPSLPKSGMRRFFKALSCQYSAHFFAGLCRKSLLLPGKGRGGFLSK